VSQFRKCKHIEHNRLESFFKIEFKPTHPPPSKRKLAAPPPRFLFLISGTYRPRRDTRFFALDSAPLQTIINGHVFTPSLQLAYKKSCLRKTSFFDRFYSRFFWTEPNCTRSKEKGVISCLQEIAPRLPALNM
jgi:hypothetical protein